MQPAHALFDGFGDLIMASYRPGILGTEEACLCCTVECGFQNTSAWYCKQPHAAHMSKSFRSANPTPSRTMYMAKSSKYIVSQTTNYRQLFRTVKSKVPPQKQANQGVYFQAKLPNPNWVYNQ